MVELPWDVDELVGEGLEFIQPAPDDLPKRVEVEVVAIRMELDHGDLDGVHVHVRGLAVQQYRVPAAQPFHIAVPSPQEGPYSAVELR